MKCLRVRYSKLGKIRFVGHRDVARIWERALRKAEIPVLYSQGFSPHPRLSFGLALPTGFESEAEYVDIYLDDDFFDIDFKETLVNQKLNDSLPDGMNTVAVGVVETSEDSGKIFIEDIRSQVHSIAIEEKNAVDFNIITELGTKPRVLRPTDLLRAMNPEIKTKNILRKEQLILQGNTRFEPLSFQKLDPAAPAEVMA